MICQDCRREAPTRPVTFLAVPEPPPANETWPKDTVRVRPGYVTRVVAQFGPYTGRYMYHCHILEHEDMEMMRPFVVVPKGFPAMGSGTKGHDPDHG
jgi:spore coat protein A